MLPRRLGLALTSGQRSATTVILKTASTCCLNWVNCNGAANELGYGKGKGDWILIEHGRRSTPQCHNGSNRS